MLSCQHITVDIARKVVSPTGAYSRLSGQVKDPVHAVDQGLEREREQIFLNKGETIPGACSLQIQLFERAWIEINKTINTTDLMSLCQQTLGQVRANKAGHARYQTTHHNASFHRILCNVFQRLYIFIVARKKTDLPDQI